MLWPVSSIRTPGNKCWICTATESLASSVWTSGLLSYPYSLTSGVDVIQKQFDGKEAGGDCMFVKSFFLWPWRSMGLLSIQTTKKWWKEEEASKESTQACCIFYAFLVWVFLLCFFSFCLFYWDLGFACVGVCCFLKKIPVSFSFWESWWLHFPWVRIR